MECQGTGLLDELKLLLAENELLPADFKLLFVENELRPADLKLLLIENELLPAELKLLLVENELLLIDPKLRFVENELLRDRQRPTGVATGRWSVSPRSLHGAIVRGPPGKGFPSTENDPRCDGQKPVRGEPELLLGENDRRTGEKALQPAWHGLRLGVAKLRPGASWARIVVSEHGLTEVDPWETAHSSQFTRRSRTP